MAQSRDIRYINREFGDFREQLIEFAKNYFPDTYNDFSPTSPGMMFIEMASYIGDVLSFYQDTQIQEIFLQHAQIPENLYSLAYMMGYKPKVTSVAEVELEVSQRVGAVGPSFTPNWNQALRVAENTLIKSTSKFNTEFITIAPVDFSYSSSYDPTEVVVYSLDGDTPSEYLLTKKVKAISAQIVSKTYTIGAGEKFLTLEIEDTDIIGVLDITDNEGFTWYEVPFLGQDTIFEEETNTLSDKNKVQSIMKLKKVPRRFTTRFTSKGVLAIQFGSGIVGDDDTTFLPNPTNVLNHIGAGINSQFTTYDPSNFLFTRSYGLAPSSIFLTVRYLKGGGVQANAPANTITNISNVNITGTDLTFSSSLSFNNRKPATGGRDGDTVEELRQNALRAFAEQGRTVTLQDYTVRALSLPSTFGSISKAYVTQDELTNSNDEGIVATNNPLALSLYVLSYDQNKNITTATQTLKNNLRTYLSNFTVLTDAVNIKDAFIVNIGVKFDIITRPNYISREVLLRCTEKLKEYFTIDNWTINQPINLSEIYTVLDRVKGVQTVQKVEIINKVGGNYSEYAYDINGATRSNIVYPSYDPCIFEVKYPDIDIQGRITTL